ncbi:MAG: hypothetical protein L6311_00780 [Cellulomonas sp.]|nr:hypothetical protein [Cellulomonas sp.]
MVTAADLVAAPRGRRLCYELAVRLPGGAEVGSAMFDESSRGHIERGGATFVAFYGGSGERPDQAAQVRTPGLVVALARLDLADVAQTSALLSALARSVDSAMYWQRPDAWDEVLAWPQVRDALLPIAEAILDHPDTSWWSAPVDLRAQVRTRFEHSFATDAARGPAPERLRRWRQSTLAHEREMAIERARQPGVSISGTWWVTPVHAGMDVTTRDLADRGSAALWLTEDSIGWESADLDPCVVDETRVLEIGGPSDWAALVARYPLEVTGSRQPDWYGALDARAGRWVIPDWSAVAADYDGVHVSVLGWLTTSGRAVPVGQDATTTLAGWDPDATWWLADVVRAVGGGRRWVREGEVWRAETRPGLRRRPPRRDGP